MRFAKIVDTDAASTVHQVYEAPIVAFKKLFGRNDLQP